MAVANQRETTPLEDDPASSDRDSSHRLLWIIVATLAALGIGAFAPIDPPPESSAAQVRTGLAILVVAAILWLTEAVPLAITALLIPVLACFLGVFADEAEPAVVASFANFAHPLIFLFLGGFGIAAALSRQGLDRWIANHILLLTRGRFRLSCYALFLISAGLSMWISNTATVALLLPVALGILADIKARSGDETARRVAPFLLLGVAYSASVGGLGTKIGSPPNGIAAATLGMSFQDWLVMGLPAVALLLPCLFVLLTILARPGKVERIELSPEPFAFTPSRIGTLAIFGLAVAAWLSSSYLAELAGIAKSFDTLVAVSALLLLAACRFVRWKDIDRTTDWGVLLLFGGGLTLSKVLVTTGTSAFLGAQVREFTSGWPLLLIIGAVVAFVIFLTELSSNTATAALFVPIFFSVAQALGVEPSRFVLPLALAASCAFMLPVATPPNAIVFGSGKVPQRTMMRIGLALNLIFLVLLTLLSAVLF